MDVFDLRHRVIGEYADYVGSYVSIQDERIKALVEQELQSGVLWPQPLVQLNPAFEPGESLERLIAAGELHPRCLDIFRVKPTPSLDHGPLRLHQHQVEGIRSARAGRSYVLTTGTGSGKSLSYIVPIVDHVLRNGPGKGIQAIIVYPMNALANSQVGELEKFLCHGFPEGQPPVTFRRYTGQEKEEERKAIVENPPDILLTNYVMLELVLTRPNERRLVEAARSLRFLVFDELHTYRGRQGSDVAMLIRRVREATGSTDLLQVGTSATLSGSETWRGQQEEVARVATQLFGVQVDPEDVIGETLRRVTTGASVGSAQAQELRQRVLSGDQPRTVSAFCSDPLARWVEETLGLAPEAGTGRLVRSKPRPLSGPDGAAGLLSQVTGLPESDCAEAIRATLLAGYGFRDDQGRPVFAFRLHQFISKGERVYASPESEQDRHITLHGQTFVPGSDRKRVLLPVAFCRECGQEYYVVERVQTRSGSTFLQPREISERPDDDDSEGGYLYINTVDPWPTDPQMQLDRFPESWVEVRPNGTRRINKNREDRVPQPHLVRPDAVLDDGGVRAWFIPAPFLFCLCCRVEYDAHQRSDFGKLATLGTEGRSSATTHLALSNIRKLRQDSGLQPEARKLLSFTDNRQDASLQAGHFNDFIEVVLLRGALRRAVATAGPSGLRHDELMPRVFDALALPTEVYALNPNVKFAAKEEADRALRKVLEYYVYRDLKRGWRVSSPNLEQCGLLDIDYLSLEELCQDDASWTGTQVALRTATPAQRERVCRVLLDHLRRELALRTPALDAMEQEAIVLLSHQHLNASWALDESEGFERSRTAWPRGRQPSDRAWDRGVFVSSRGGYGQFLRRSTTFPDAPARLKREDSADIIRDLFRVLCEIGGLLVESVPTESTSGVAGYQLKAGMMVWRPGDGSRAFHDPVRVPNAPADGLRTNPFFVSFYGSDITDMRAIEGREHTAQVSPELREEREDRFRSAALPVLFCSPTMELGVDISQLNVVNMRNVPPTPANYAQRSGRAGRSGQPAFVYTYCSAYSPHDQYFFKRPERMVGGSVSTPRLDLANEDLLRAHVHAIWLACARLDLHSSLAQVLDVDGDPPTLAPRGPVKDALANPVARQMARSRARMALGPTIHALSEGQVTVDEWLQRVLDELPTSFDRACERWRTLYKAAHATSKRQGAIVIDASRSAEDRERARRLRAEAEAQLKLLLAAENANQQSDFYSYRYFASEGFLPGYNFPRLPLSAWIPGRRRRAGKDEYLQRPRFLAIGEFGPRGIVYHEGSRYVIHKAMLPVEGEESTITRSAVQCDQCGYLHPIDDKQNPDCCERCKALLPPAMDNLFAMRNVVARRRDRINSDEEERMRLGYDLRTGVRYARRLGQDSQRSARLMAADGGLLADLEYGHAATLWRINLGWRRRTAGAPAGFLLDEETGVWASQQVANSGPQGPTIDADMPGTSRKQRVVPFVEDRRNCLVLRAEGIRDAATLASLQSALKVSVQTLFQLEDSELAAEPLPDQDDRRLILLYEAAEGGAGVLRRLVDDPRILPQLAREALARCHFDPDTGQDLHRSPNGREDCEAACYDCLLSYYNQRDHRIIDRQRIRDILLAWRDGKVATSPRPLTREEHVERLLRLCQSDLERRWLRFLADGGWNLPSDAQYRFERLKVQADFYFREQQVVVFVDGPHHDDPAQQARDRQQAEALLDVGFPMVVRFHHAADWRQVLRTYQSVFGTPWDDDN
ncbi:DEAD/DEAH box helicase [Myxococcota bacterium]|nr:DEAD/DEAH box helicase [Myxococcota bacterium]